MEHFLKNEAKGTNIIGATSLADMVNKLKTPRKVMLLVKGRCHSNVIRNFFFKEFVGGKKRFNH